MKSSAKRRRSKAQILVVNHFEVHLTLAVRKANAPNAANAHDQTGNAAPEQAEPGGRPATLCKICARPTDTEDAHEGIFPRCTACTLNNEATTAAAAFRAGGDVNFREHRRAGPRSGHISRSPETAHPDGPRTQQPHTDTAGGGNALSEGRGKA